MAIIQKTVSQERIRGPDLRVLVKTSEEVPFYRAVVMVEKAKGVMVSNKRIDGAFQSNEWKQIKDGLLCHTGTHTGYIEPNTLFSEKSLLVINDNELERLAGTRYFIEYIDPNTKKHWLFPVHPDYLGKQNSILVSEHPNYTLVPDGNRIITLPLQMSLKEAVGIVEGFPTENGWHLTDPQHGIPTLWYGDESVDKRFLFRIDKRVGAAGRCYGDKGIDAVVFLDFFPSFGRGVVIEATAGGAPLETGANKLQIISQGSGTITLTGSDEKIQTALRVLKSQNLV